MGNLWKDATKHAEVWASYSPMCQSTECVGPIPPESLESHNHLWGFPTPKRLYYWVWRRRHINGFMHIGDICQMSFSCPSYLVIHPHSATFVVMSLAWIMFNHIGDWWLVCVISQSTSPPHIAFLHPGNPNWLISFQYLQSTLEWGNHCHRPNVF